MMEKCTPLPIGFLCCCFTPEKSHTHTHTHYMHVLLVQHCGQYYIKPTLQA